jgi:hypothetical protein
MVGGRKMNSISIHDKIKEAEAREFPNSNFAVLVLKGDNLEIQVYFEKKEEIQELLSRIEEAYKNIKVIKK